MTNVSWHVATWILTQMQMSQMTAGPEADVELTNVSVGQRLVQGQDAAVRWHGGDGAFFRLPRVVAGGGDADLVSDLRTHNKRTSGKQMSESSHAAAASVLAFMWKADLPVDGLRQGQSVGSSGSGRSQFGVVHVVRLSIKLQSTKHTCGTTTQKVTIDDVFFFFFALFLLPSNHFYTQYKLICVQQYI